jgi:hypothetical protein
MGIFNSKKVSITNEKIISDICGDVSKALMVLVDEGHLPIEKTSEIWAVIASVGEQTLESDDERARLIQHLHDLTFDEDHSRAFENRKEIPFYEMLSRPLVDKSVKDGTNIIASIRDLTNSLSRMTAADREKRSYELSRPLFLHYLNGAAVQAKDDSDDFIWISIVLSMPFSSITRYILDSKPLYSEADWVRQFDLLNFMMSLMIVRWGILKFAQKMSESHS